MNALLYLTKSAGREHTPKIDERLSPSPPIKRVKAPCYKKAFVRAEGFSDLAPCLPWTKYTVTCPKVLHTKSFMIAYD